MNARIQQFLSNPWIGAIGSLAGVLGLFSAGYFYYASIGYSQLAVYVQPVKTVVVSQQQLSDLRVFYQDHQFHDVTAVQLAVWNAGNQPIRPEDILETIRILIQPPKPVLKVSILKVTRPVVNFGFSSADFPSGTIPLSWKILESGDGALVQIVYAGPSTADVWVDGTVVGERRIRFGNGELPSRSGYWAGIIVAVVMFGTALWMGYLGIADSSGRLFTLISSLISLFFAAFLVYALWSPVVPPFTF